MKTEKMNNDEIPCSMQMPKTDGQSAASKHVRKEIDDWLFPPIDKGKGGKKNDFMGTIN